jgi:hypothetical protein
MSGTSRMHKFVVVLAAGLLIFTPFVAAQQCKQRGVITADADVYANPPRYVTGAGWQGSRMAHLGRGTQVYVCQERSVDFGFSEKKWSQIAYPVDRQWQYGWILKDNLGDWRGGNGYDEIPILSLIATAHAAASPASSAADPKWELPVMPPETRRSIKQESTLPAGAASTAAWADLATLYAPLFIGMLFGMVAKVLVDFLDAREKATLWAHARSGVIAILVSPIVFLGFLTAGQFESGKQTFVVLWLLAFQNGFFWQTVLKRDGARTTNNNGAPDAAERNVQ